MNFGITSDDAMTLSVAAHKAVEHRLKTEEELARTKPWDQLSNQEKILGDYSPDRFRDQIASLVRQDEKKRTAMSRLMDLTNANSSAVIAANREKAMNYFARHQADTGSPEVQGYYFINSLV